MLFFELSIQGKKVSFSTIMYSSTTVFNIDRVRVISEGSCDTEDPSNDAENSALPLQE